MPLQGQEDLCRGSAADALSFASSGDEQPSLQARVLGMGMSKYVVLTRNCIKMNSLANQRGRAQSWVHDEVSCCAWRLIMPPAAPRSAVAQSSALSQLAPRGCKTRGFLAISFEFGSQRLPGPVDNVHNWLGALSGRMVLKEIRCTVARH